MKGHQDKLKGGQKIHSPFSREVDLNLQMDKDANYARASDVQVAPLRRTYKHTALGIYDSNNQMITDLKRYLYDMVNGNAMKEYINRKYNWCPIEQELIDWGALEKALKKYSEYKKSKIVQLMYNWQNDGQQKVLHHESENGECPSKCGEFESHNHYLHCKNEKMCEARSEKRRTL